jgi:hypothetical protein
MGKAYGYCYQVTQERRNVVSEFNLPYFDRKSEAIKHIVKRGMSRAGVLRYCKNKDGSKSWVTAGEVWNNR